MQPDSLGWPVLHLTHVKVSRGISFALAQRKPGPITGTARNFVNGAAKRKKALPRLPSEKLKLLLHQKTTNAQRVHS